MGHLVLSRKPGEEIVIPHLGITLSIITVRGDRVRVGIKAPSQLAVHRKEVWDRIVEEHGEAAALEFDDTAEDAALVNDPQLMSKLKG